MYIKFWHKWNVALTCTVARQPPQCFHKTSVRMYIKHWHSPVYCCIALSPSRWGKKCLWHFLCLSITLQYFEIGLSAEISYNFIHILRPTHKNVKLQETVVLKQFLSFYMLWKPRKWKKKWKIKSFHYFVHIILQGFF